MNAAALLAFRAKARAQVEELYPATVKFADEVELAATTAGLKRAEQLASGFFDEYTISFRIRLELLPDGPPEPGAPITWVEQGLTFRVDAVKAGATFYTLGCNSQNSASR